MTTHTTAANNLIGERVHLAGHFQEPVTVEGVRPLGSSVELQVRRGDGQLDETILSADEVDALLAQLTTQAGPVPLADPHQLRLLVESARIRLAYAYDRHFAVSLSGIRTLPHQIEAVYLKMLPQPRLRFLLADDPGAGKTIMAGLLLKEMKLREAIERVLILVPAPLTIQWQDELLRFFGESFQIIHSGNDQQQLINLWQRENQVIASIDYAKQDSVRERVWQQRWDVLIVDEAHKCSAYTRRRTGRAAEVDKTKRYQLAERLVARVDHVLLLTATPHHGDDDRFGHFVRLIDPDVFPEPHRLGEQARAIRRDILNLAGDVRDWPRLRLQVLELTPQPRFRALIEELLDVWRHQAPATSPGSVALALLSAAAAAQHYRHEQSVELIWTGPDIPGFPLRRTDQALVQVIDAAQKSLLIVSFVVYRVPAITQALIRVFERGVFIRICVEAPEPSGQRVAYDTIQALGQAVLQRAAIYIWPRDQRPTDPSGRAGSLHAKCAVADHELLFISSANLTGHAMHLNMELGVLIRGGRQPATVATHFERLIERGVLERVEVS